MEAESLEAKETNTTLQKVWTAELESFHRNLGELEAQIVEKTADLGEVLSGVTENLKSVEAMSLEVQKANLESIDNLKRFESQLLNIDKVNQDLISGLEVKIKRLR